MPCASIAEVITEMERRYHRLEASGDFRAVFARSYLTTTRHVARAIEAGAFLDGAWVDRIDRAFASRYFDAFDAFAASQRCPAPWALQFESVLSRRTFVLQDILLGMNAHISYDLPLSLLDTIPQNADPALVEQRRRDFETLNDVLERAIDDVQREAAWAYDPTLGVLDAALGRIDEWATSKLIRAARARVFQDFLQLQEARRGGVIALGVRTIELELRAEGIAKSLLLPQRTLGPLMAPMGPYRKGITRVRHALVAML
jgi:hypothetical protein